MKISDQVKVMTRGFLFLLRKIYWVMFLLVKRLGSLYLLDQINKLDLFLMKYSNLF